MILNCKVLIINLKLTTLYLTELNTFLKVKHQKDVEISKIDGKLNEEYEDRLQKALHELRDIYDEKMRQNKDDFEKRYEDRVSEI